MVNIMYMYMYMDNQFLAVDKRVENLTLELAGRILISHYCQALVQKGMTNLTRDGSTIEVYSLILC